MRSRGFTLIELLVVISIIVLMSSVLLARTTRLNSSVRIDASVQKILTAFREARHNSIAVVGFGASQFPSYGVYAEVGESDITIYVDCEGNDNGDDEIDNGDSFHRGDDSCGGGNTYSVTALEPGVSVSEIGYRPYGQDPLVTSPDAVSVLFMRPEPVVWAVTEEGGANTVQPNSEVYITIHDARSNEERVVEVNTNGIAYVSY